MTNLPALIEKSESGYAKALGGMVPSERFTRIAISAVKGNPDIANLDQTSVLKAIMQAAQDGLVIDGKQAAIVPFKGKATYIPMVQGLLMKIRQHSEFASISTAIIYDNEVKTGAFEYVKGDEEYLNHKPIVFGERGPAVGAYAVVTMKDGAKFRLVMTREQIEKRLKKGADSGAKKEWQEEFWLKTVIRAIYKIAPNSGDEAGVLDKVLNRDEDDDDAPVTVEHTPAEEEVPKTRAAAAVRQAARTESNPPPRETIEDANYVTIDEDGVIMDEELPL